MQGGSGGGQKGPCRVNFEGARGPCRVDLGGARGPCRVDLGGARGPCRVDLGGQRVWCRVYLVEFIISESERGPPCPAECPRERHRPVCASDGKLYRSHCVFQRARCQEPLLQALPRFRCGGTHRDPTKDRAAALARRQADSIYVPECDEDGSFFQVQCHRQTGYCWCATAEGKPISGTSVLNQTPNCTGTWQEGGGGNFGRRALGSFLPPPPPNLSPPLSEGTSLPFLIPIILPDFKPNRTVKRIQEFPPSCEQERLEALEEIQQHQQEGTFVPECEGDDTYKPIQCHQATGYCWCVQADTGRPIPGTSTRSVSSSRVGCPGPKKAEFLSNLMKALTSDMIQSRLIVSASRRLSDRTPGPSLEERAARWHFVRLDKDFSDGLSEQELRPLKLYVKQHTRPKRCARKFLEYCDLDANRLVSLPELRGCLGLS
uniref:SPARC related modular calcium binding 1 n=1 Tax=Gopherus evgoodei TaxID=1825980 RepID=A0A8C4YDT1_9SAUR